MKRQLTTLLIIGITLSSAAAPLQNPTSKNMVPSQPTRQSTDIWSTPNYTIHSQLALNIDKKAHFKSTHFAVLIPLKDTRHLLQFTQLAIQRQDQQWTGNFGVGARYFQHHFMLGGNAFFNKNYTNHQQNISLGIEVAANFIKFTANDYLRLSNSWSDSVPLPHYRQQPANGYDLLLQAWLPMYPQLGATFSYQKYYGGLIGLMGKDDDSNALYSDASNTRVGINYTPIPLITLGASFQASEDKQHETQWTMNLHYVFGESLSRQLDPDEVMNLRTLNGQRYSLVQRNDRVIPRLQLI